MLLASLLAWEALREHLRTPVAFAGHSLGQVTALIAAGALPLEQGVRFAARRAELTQAAADAHPGRMAALLGADAAEVRPLLDDLWTLALLWRSPEGLRVARTVSEVLPHPAGLGPRAADSFVEVPPAEECPDAVFVEDAAVVFGDVAVVTRQIRRLATRY